MTASRPASEASPAARPLYAQVEEILTRRIAEGHWRPGDALPPEPDLAAELGVSQGTVRKALDALERRHLIERRQGRGTFVAAHTDERALFHFFRVVDLRGVKRAPTSLVAGWETVPATAAEARALHLPQGTPVHRIARLRILEGRARIVERITLPAALFAGFDLPVGKELPTELYVHYQQRHGITVARAEERLRAVTAEGFTARSLDREEGHPLIEIERIAFDVAGRRVGRRLSWLDTTLHRYAVSLD